MKRNISVKKTAAAKNVTQSCYQHQEVETCQVGVRRWRMIAEGEKTCWLH